MGSFQDLKVYKKAFECSDSDMENSETQVWLDYAEVCQYLQKTEFDKLKSKSQEVGKMIQSYD